jgi:glyoxylase-like metal-dependent hydrolase (beta-lactamase superfamily II)
MLGSRSALGLTLALAVTTGSAAAQEQDFSKVEIKSEKLAEGLYVLFGSGGNIGASVGSDGVFLIDDQYAPLSEKILAALKSLSDKPVRLLVNTHWHGDHTGGNENFAKAGSLIVAHENVRVRLSAEQFIPAFNRSFPAVPEVARPVVTHRAGLTLHWNGAEVRVLHPGPAHTDGDSVLQFPEANVVHMGDCFFNGLYPFIDASSGGSLEGVIAAADHVLGLTDDQTKFIPGHGPVGTKSELQAFRDMLASVRDRLRPLAAAGKTAKEVVAAKPLADLDEKWGKGFLSTDAFTEIAFSALAPAK